MRSWAPVLVVLLLAGCASDPSPSSPGDAPRAEGDGKGPAWSFVGIDGETYSRDEPAANATVLFFMATWCSSCRSKAPMIADVIADQEGKGVRMLSVDFDPSESRDALRAWQERYGHDWPHGLDEGQQVQRALAVRSQSTVVVLDTDGNVIRHFPYGQVSEAALRDAIATALAA